MVWWKHYCRNDFVRSDEFLVLLLRSASRELVGVAPLFRSSSRGIGPAWCRIVQFFGADASITEVGKIAWAARGFGLAMLSYGVLGDDRYLSARLRGYRSGKSCDAGIASD